MNQKQIARIAGVSCLLMVIFGLFAEVFFRQKIFSSNDSSTVANLIESNQLLYRIGILSDMLMALFYLLTALFLCQLFVSVNKSLAITMLVLASAGSILIFFNVLFELAPFYILNGNGFMKSLEEIQRESLAMLFYNLYQHGYMMGQIFFSLWVLPLGILIHRSKFIPKIFGILFIFEAFLGFSSVLVHFIAPNLILESLLMLPMILAEFSFMLFLIIRGTN